MSDLHEAYNEMILSQTEQAQAEEAHRQDMAVLCSNGVKLVDGEPCRNIPTKSVLMQRHTRSFEYEGSGGIFNKLELDKKGRMI